MEDIRISIALTETEHAAALAYIDRRMRESFGCAPPPTHGVIFIALREAQIVGTLVYEGVPDDQTLFSLEERYEFETQSAPLPFVRTQIVQGSRWTAEHPNASRLLSREASRVAIALGKRSVLLEAKSYTAKRLGEFGIGCHPIPTARLQLEKAYAAVGKDGMKYFVEPPSPSLYMMDLQQMVQALST